MALPLAPKAPPESGAAGSSCPCCCLAARRAAVATCSGLYCMYAFPSSSWRPLLWAFFAAATAAAFFVPAPEGLSQQRATCWRPLELRQALTGLLLAFWQQRTWDGALYRQLRFGFEFLLTKIERAVAVPNALVRRAA
jgi:hypothetical protein